MCNQLILLASCNKKENYNKEITKHVDFLRENHKPAKEYILDLFEKNDLVILCERYHHENTQYELITDVISDTKFIKN